MRLEMTIYKTSHSFLSFNSYIWLKLYQMNNYILKSISFAVLLFAALPRAGAQDADVALAKAYYQFSHIRDTTKAGSPAISEMVLYMGEKGSLYRGVQDEESKPLLHQAKGGSLATFDIIEESSAQVFLAGKSHRVERIIDNKYIITEDQPHIDWQLHEDVKMIEGYEAQKATALFGGRFYTAWFTPDIPFSYGPWKLQGLPGLILEARDSKNEVVFEFRGFQIIPEGEAVKIALPQSFKFRKVTHEQFEKIYVGFLADPMGFMKASLGLPMDADSQITGINKGEVIPHNPLEIRK